jgi:hypothetical protein
MICRKMELKIIKLSEINHSEGQIQQVFSNTYTLDLNKTKDMNIEVDYLGNGLVGSERRKREWRI